MSLALLFHYLLLNMFWNVSTSIFRSLRLIVDLFHVLYYSVRLEVLALATKQGR